MLKGLYRFTCEYGHEWAVAKDVTGATDVEQRYRRNTYIALGCLPAFEELPTKEAYRLAGAPALDQANLPGASNSTHILATADIGTQSAGVEARSPAHMASGVSVSGPVNEAPPVRRQRWTD